ncbi:urease accessory protein UreD [Pseudoneobacillus sp. C159]
MEDWTGVLYLEAEKRKGKTIAKNVYFHGAFKVMRPIYHDQSGQPCYYILNPGGGYLDGDRYRLKITLDKEAQMTLTTQSATKVYKTPTGYAYQEMEIYLGAGSYLEYLPDPLIAYRDARYKQKNVINMEKGAVLLYTDIITPGWSPDGERFSYSQLQLLNEIYLDDELVAFDHINLQPANRKMNSIGLLEGFSHIGSLIVIGEKTSPELLDRIYDSLPTTKQDYKIGLSQLPVPGFTIRILANSTQLIESIILKCHQLINEEWFQKKPSFLRKY